MELSAEASTGIGPVFASESHLSSNVVFDAGPVFRSRAYAIADRRVRVRLDEGFDAVLLTGEAGSGRTTFLSALAAQLGARTPAIRFARAPETLQDALGCWRELEAACAACAFYVSSTYECVLDDIPSIACRRDV